MEFEKSGIGLDEQMVKTSKNDESNIDKSLLDISKLVYIDPFFSNKKESSSRLSRFFTPPEPPDILLL
tara:strand:- start:960 stop:1163 length:204 start_codon:yes stop_codon:yes gene_type:complete